MGALRRGRRDHVRAETGMMAWIAASAVVLVILIALLGNFGDDYD